MFVGVGVGVPGAEVGAEVFTGALVGASVGTVTVCLDGPGTSKESSARPKTITAEHMYNKFLVLFIFINNLPNRKRG